MLVAFAMVAENAVTVDPDDDVRQFAGGLVKGVRSAGLAKKPNGGYRIVILHRLPGDPHPDPGETALDAAIQLIFR